MENSTLIQERVFYYSIFGMSRRGSQTSFEGVKAPNSPKIQLNF